jgi:integral membrane protein
MKKLEGALLRYRIMAFVVGVALLVLCLVGIPLQYAAGKPQVVAVVGPIHGALYIIYLLTVIDLARRARFSLLELAAMISSGFFPFLAFVMEHEVNLRVRRILDRREATTSSAPA